MKQRNVFLALALFFFATSLKAQNCDPWIVDAYKLMYKRTPTATECNIKNYNNGSWRSKAELIGFIDACVRLSSTVRLEKLYSTSIGAVHLKEPHSITSVPCFVSSRIIEIVNSSTGVCNVCMVIFAVPRLCALLYSVPHCPVCLFTIKSTPSLCGTVHKV